MTLWRISNHPSLDGAGGLRASARWHTIGRRIMYCASNPAAALVEVLAHMEIDAGELPTPLQYSAIEAPGDLPTETVVLDSLGRNWQVDLRASRAAGDEWLRSGRTALLLVPSVVVPATWNVLINPQHPASGRIRVVRLHRHAIDPRLPR